MSLPDYKYLGFGLGLRPEFYNAVIESKPKVDWFEIMTEDYLVPGGRPLYYLDQISPYYPLVMHGVSLSIGTKDPLNLDYLRQVKSLADRINPRWISDHLCWTGLKGYNTHDLLPLPYTKEALSHVVEKIKQVQDFLGFRILIENVSSYVNFKESEFSEWEFLTLVAEQSDCFILLDINNIYVSGFNHQFNPMDYINHIPINRVKQFHLAGHTQLTDHIIDTHDHDIVDPVWQLYESAVKRFGQVSTMIERDGNIPPFDDLYAELQKAKAIAAQVLELEIA
ncbi:MAG: DUF692 domain-containing protein [Proteobacteria bacterium]|nr:DUF692 domain-containing protein [Pseudomonadota bacterium]